MKSNRKMHRWLTTTVVVATAIALYLYDTSALYSEWTDGTPDAPGSAALRAAIDPETGDLLIGAVPQQLPGDPDKALEADLDRMLSRSDEGLEAVNHPDGRVSVHLKGRFMSASVARINADGGVETLCTEHAPDAHNFLDATTEIDSHGREVR